MAMVFVGFLALLSEFGVGTAVIAIRDLRDEHIAQAGVESDQRTHRKITGLATAVTPAYLATVRSELGLLRRYLLEPTRAIALVAFPLFVGLAVAAPDAVPLVLRRH